MTLHTTKTNRQRISKLTKGIVTASVILTTVTTAMFSMVVQADDKVYRWRMQRYTGTETQQLFKDFAREVRKASEGRLLINNFSGGELVPNDQLLKATSSGVMQMSYGYGAYWGGSIDLARIESGLPLAWTTLDEAKELWFEKGLNELLVDAYAEHKVRYMTPSFGGDYDLLSKEPITSIDDMKKAKIRATSNVSAVLQKFDVPTVYLPPEELYTSMSTNSISGIIYGSAYDYEQLKLHETAKHYTKLSLLTPGFVDNILVNQKAWDELPEDLQKILDTAVKKLAENHHNWLVDGAKKTLGSSIFEVHTLDTADVTKLTDAAQELWGEEAKRSERNAKAIDMIKALAENKGRLK
ncbi:MAG: TRAP transporter substrate-binding protein DctP [Arenicella sp.]